MKQKHKVYLSNNDRMLLITIFGNYIRYNQSKAIITLNDGTQDFEPKLNKLLKSLGLKFEVF